MSVGVEERNMGRKKRERPAKTVRLDADLITKCKSLADDEGTDVSNYLSSSDPARDRAGVDQVSAADDGQGIASGPASLEVRPGQILGRYPLANNGLQPADLTHDMDFHAGGRLGMADQPVAEEGDLTQCLILGIDRWWRGHRLDFLLGGPSCRVADAAYPAQHDPDPMRTS